MCRFAVRNGQAAAAPLDAPKLEAPPINLDALFAQGHEELDASDLALLALFSGQGPAGGAEDGQQQPASAGSSAGSPLGASCNTVVVGQAMTAPATQQAAGGAAAAPGLLPVPANPVQQLQFHAVLQHQAAIMQNPGTYPAAAQMYQQAMLQTGVLPSQPSGTLTYSGSLATGNAPVPAPGPAPVLGKRGKTQEEIEEQTERIKKRRRESAQRSRQRKNAYMKSLEMENRALKLENERLRMELGKSSGAPLPPRAAAPKASSASVSRSDACLGDDSDHGSDHEEEEGGLCNPLMATGMVGGVALDPLALMPTADLLSFAF